jgi:hypothetical protein
MEKLYEYKTMKSQGARHHFIRFQGEDIWRLHRWDGPAVEPIDKDCELKKGYYLNGIPYDEENYNTLMREREGLPWYKNPSMKNSLTDYRN